MQLKEIGILLILVISTSAYAQKNRKVLVERHKVIVHEFDSMSSLSVGNGNFAATVFATGMQTSLLGWPSYNLSSWKWFIINNDCRNV